MRVLDIAVAAVCMAAWVSASAPRPDGEAGRRQYLFRPVRRRGRAAGSRHPALREAAREGPAARREAGDHPARRHRPQSGGRQAHGAGTDHARPRAAAGRHGLHAERAGDRAAGDRGQGAVHRHECRHRDDHHQVAVHRARVVHHVAVELSAGCVGGEERHQEGLHRGVGLWPGDRRRGGVHQGLHRRRRADRRLGAHAAAQSRLRAVHAARQGCQVRMRCSPSSRRQGCDGADEDVRRSRTEAGRHQADRSRRHLPPTKNCRTWATWRSAW